MLSVLMSPGLAFPVTASYTLIKGDRLLSKHTHRDIMLIVFDSIILIGFMH